MPYKSTQIKIAGTEHDRSRKLSEQKKSEIREAYADAKNQRELARRFCVSPTTISFVLFPEKYEKSKVSLKKRKAEGRYKPTKEKMAATMRRHRRYKQQLHLNGKI